MNLNTSFYFLNVVALSLPPFSLFDWEDLCTIYNFHFSFFIHRCNVMDNEKQQRSPGPFSSLSNNRVAKESQDGREEFSRVGEDEKKRVQQVAEKENERILQEMKENGTVFALTRSLLFRLLKSASEERPV